METSCDVIKEQYELYLEKVTDDSFKEGEEHGISKKILGLLKT